MLRSFVKCAIDQMCTTVPPYPATVSKCLAILWNQLPSIGSTEWHSSVVFSSGGGMRGTAFPFRFWRGNAIPVAYTTAVGGCGGMCRTPASTPSSAKV